MTKLKRLSHGVRLGRFGNRRRGTPSALEPPSPLVLEYSAADAMLASSESVTCGRSGVGDSISRRNASGLPITLVTTGHDISSEMELNAAGGRSSSTSSAIASVFSASLS